jgi:hypothetical protein
MMYKAKIDRITPYDSNGTGVNPNNPANGALGMIMTSAATCTDAVARHGLGLFLKNGVCDRTIKTMSVAETTDSMNHPVWNSCSLA